MEDPVRRRGFRRLAGGVALQLLAVTAVGTMIVVAQATASTKPSCAPASGPASPPASPQATVPCGSISGTVTDGASHGLAGICVQAEPFTFPGFFASGQTDAAGRYLITNVPPSSYKVRFTDCFARTHIEQWFNNKPDFASADVVVVNDGADTPNINAALVTGGSISGTITDTAAHPLLGMCVYAFNQTSSYGFSQSKQGGTYTISGLSPGSYVVEFYDCTGNKYVPQWYNNQPTFDTADPVVVNGGANTPNINAALVSAGAISGTVTDTGAQPLPGICVTAYDATSDVEWSFDQTDSSGAYALTGLNPGSYKVEFSDCGASVYVTQWFNNKANFASANPVAVTSGTETGGINAVLVRGGTISGQVVDNSLQPLGGICVIAHDPTTGDIVSSTTTKAEGMYVLSGLANGKYKIEFFDCVSTTHATQWANNKATFDTANLIAAKVNTDHSGVNARMRDAT